MLIGFDRHLVMIEEILYYVDLYLTFISLLCQQLSMYNQSSLQVECLCVCLSAISRLNCLTYELRTGKLVVA